MQGLHLTADLYHCSSDPRLLIDAASLADLCRLHTLDVGLNLVDEKWHTFPDYQGKPGGVTGMLLLAESHLAVHTWPELGAVTLDVYVCNFTGDNSQKAEFLISALEAALAPRESQRQRLWRGDAHGPGRQGDLVTESVSPESVYGFRFTRRLLTQRTPYQHLELLESAELGRTLRLDGCFMTSEADEFFYHEALVHPVAIAHPQPRRALIIGGGDGGAAEELLKHPSIEHIRLAELDAEVVQVAREHLQAIHKGALDDPRVAIHIEDGAAYVEHTEDRFDLVLLDLTDPETPAGPLYTTAFFERVRRVLAPGGALVLHLGAPFFEDAQVRSLGARLGEAFEVVRGYGLYIPLYGAYWALAVASQTLDAKAVDTATVQKRLDARGLDDLQYYNAEVHGALFALPNHHRRLMPA